MPTVLVIENNQGIVGKIYRALSDNFEECECYPQNADNVSREMLSLIDKAIRWDKEPAGEKKEDLARELGDFISGPILKGKVPDYAIIDVCLLLTPEGDDHIGAKVRSEILAKLFPDLQVLYSTDFPEKVRLGAGSNFYNVNGRDIVMGKGELGGLSSFTDILVNDFAKYSGLQRINRKATIIRNEGGTRTAVPVSEMLKLRNFVNDASNYILGICSVLKIISIAATFLLYLGCLAVLLFKFVKILLYEEGEEVISHILQVIEKLFIIPLPLIIVTGISIFFDQVIALRFSPDYKKFQGIEGNSKYYINLSKSLFISTLISVLAIKLIELSFPVATTSIGTWQGFAMLGLCILVLFLFYLIIARSLHNLLNHKTQH